MTNKNWFVTSKKLLKSYSSLNIKFLHLYNFIDLTPSIIEIHNIIDYAYNIQTMIQ